MSTNTSFNVDDDDAAKDSIAALEALMTIKRSSVDFSDSSCTKNSKDATHEFIESTSAISDKKPKANFHIPSTTELITGFHSAPLHVTAAASAPKVMTLKSKAIHNLKHANASAHDDGRSSSSVKGLFDTKKIIIPSVKNNNNTLPKSGSNSLLKSPIEAVMKSTTSPMLLPIHTTLKDTPDPALNTEEVDLFVHSEKIKAALKSKPQRGKKRENLNAFERLELTRTRNREHAKSTRYVYDGCFSVIFFALYHAFRHTPSCNCSK